MSRKPEREIVLDTETTGLYPQNGDRIVEIGALEIIDKQITGRKFHYYLNPQREVPMEAYRVHGISTEFLRDKPLFSDVVDEFMDFVGGSRLVIHNAPFDIKFLNAELERVNKPVLKLSEAVDTLKLARKKHPGARVNLDALCKRYGVDNSTRNYHGALLDAELLVEVYIELTGGRQSSFTIQKQEEEVSFTDYKELSTKGNKIIIRPTQEELKRHNDFIKMVTNEN